MTKRGLNLYELIFGVFFLLKVTKTGVVANWNWFFIFLPIIIYLIHKFFVYVWEGTGMNKDFMNKLADAYVERKKRQFAKKALRDAKKGR